MGDCNICGMAAGFLKNTHKECVRRRRQGMAHIVSMVQSCILHPGVRKRDLDHLSDSIGKLASSRFIDNQTVRSLLVSGWESAVESAFEDGLLSETEESALCQAQDYFSLTQPELERNGALSKVTKGAVLRDLIDGKVPDRVAISGDIPFNLQKTEQLVWLFQNVIYYEEQTRTEFVGGSAGFNIRIAKGLYYRTSAFKGRQIKTAGMVLTDVGLLGVTDRNLYFAGRSKRFRIAYNKIVAFEPFSDGIGVQRDALTARPQTFRTGDGWFTVNLIRNLAEA